MARSGAMKERRKDFTKRERFEVVRANIAQRLRRVCEGMSWSELWRLSAAMARIQLKYEPLTGMPQST